MDSTVVPNGTVADAGEGSTPVCAPPHDIAGDQADMAISYLPFVKTIAARVYDKLPAEAGVDLDDLVQAGSVGLLAAARSYDPASNVSFALYARHRVRGEIFDTLRSLDIASRQWRRLQKQTEEARRELAGRLNREPTAEEVTAELQKEDAAAADRALDLLFAQALSSEQSLEFEVQADPGSHPDSLFLREEAAQMLKRAVETLPERHRVIIRAYYSQNMTMKQIGRSMGVNESRICQMHKCALETMGTALRSWGIHGSAA